MFEETINGVKQVKEDFSNQVRDSFGSSIISDVFENLEKEEEKLRLEYEIAETKMSSIKAITAELRLII